jgi:hypothetical protein
VDEIFVSYRRRDSSLFVDLLVDRLRRVSGVFMDVDDIELGIPFMSRIQQAISHARLVIVVIGLHWDPSRLHDENDVVAYELRTAHRFARRVIPVVLVPGTMPTLASLPSDFEWFAQLNAFIMPEPPEHRAYLVQLAELVTGTLTAEHEAPARVFSVPGDAEMLKHGRGNIAFTETAMAKDMRLCSIAQSGRKVWLASDAEVEIRDLTTGSLCNSARQGAEWLQATSWGALTATSAIGYQAPDTISFSQLRFVNDAIVSADTGFTWSWQFPPMALSVEEDTFIVAVETPRRRDVILFSVNDRKEIGACAFPDSHVVSMCFDPTGERYFAAAVAGDRMLLNAVDTAASSIQWSREIPPTSKTRREGPEVTFWHSPATLLVNTGAALFEFDPSSGEIRRTLMTSASGLDSLATDPSTSLACIAEGPSLRMWMPGAESFLTVDLAGDQCRACSLQDGFIATLVGTDTRCRLLTASTSEPASAWPTISSKPL